LINNNYTNFQTKSPRWDLGLNDFAQSAKQAHDELVGAHEVRTRVNLAVAAAHLHAPMDQLRLSLPPSLVVVDSYSIGPPFCHWKPFAGPFISDLPIFHAKRTSTLAGFLEIVSFVI
jgi:hypothetical protein